MVIAFSHSDGQTYWRARCDCGREKVARGNAMRFGTTKSCGCLYRDTRVPLGSALARRAQDAAHTRLRDRLRAGKKRCTWCDRTKPLAMFVKCAASPDGRDSHCRKCSAARDLERHYGISSDEQRRMMTEQKHRCAICGLRFGANRKPHTDHRHRDKKVRGLLCSACNLGIGHFADDPQLLRRAIRYLTA